MLTGRAAGSARRRPYGGRRDGKPVRRRPPRLRAGARRRHGLRRQRRHPQLNPLRTRQTPTQPPRHVFLTAKDETADRIEGFRTGVDAYLTKPFEPDELVAVIRSILARVQRTHAEIARLVGTSQGEGAQDVVRFQDEALTEAEGRIAAAVARGLSNKEIAAEFGISVRTVENHISHILDKKGFGNRVEIARYVLDRAQPGDKS